jgi:hypothetical protein
MHGFDDIFLRGLVLLALNFIRVKYQALAGCAQTRCFSLPLSPPSSLPNATSFPFFSTSSYNSNVCLCLVCVLRNFPLLSVNEFLFGVVRFVVYQETTLCRGVSDATLESEANTFDQRRFGRPSSRFRQVFGHSWQIHTNRSACFVYPCDLDLLLAIAYYSSQRQVVFPCASTSHFQHLRLHLLEHTYERISLSEMVEGC